MSKVSFLGAESALKDRLSGINLPKITVLGYNAGLTQTTGKATGGIGQLKFEATPDMLIRLYIMQSFGTSIEDMAKQLEVTPLVVNNILTSDDFSSVRSILTKDIVDLARDKLTVASQKAVDTLIKLLDSNDERIQLRASTEILNRVGVIIPQKLEVAVTQTVVHAMEQDQLEAIIKAGNTALNKSNNIVIDKTKIIEVVDDEPTS